MSIYKSHSLKASEGVVVVVALRELCVMELTLLAQPSAALRMGGMLGRDYGSISIMPF